LILPSSMSFAVFNLRKRSLRRATSLVIGGLLLALLLAGFPNDRPSLKLLVPLLLAFAGTFDTARCLRLRWSFYHGAVVLLLYSDIMALCMILFLLIYPYAEWLI
jgi:hypothetical protein